MKDITPAVYRYETKYSHFKNESNWNSEYTNKNIKTLLKKGDT